MVFAQEEFLAPDPNTARLMLAYITRVPYFDKRPLRRLARLETILISENQRVRLIEFRLYMDI